MIAIVEGCADLDAFVCHAFPAVKPIYCELVGFFFRQTVNAGDFYPAARPCKPCAWLCSCLANEGIALFVLLNGIFSFRCWGFDLSI